MILLCLRVYLTAVLFFALFVHLNARAALPLSSRRSKRQSSTCYGRVSTHTGSYSQCRCGLQIRSVTTTCCGTFGCWTLTSRTERRACRVTCSSGQRQPIPGAVTQVGSSYSIQCSCEAGYTYDQQTGCCRGACFRLNCKAYQRCVTQQGVVYCEDTCSGYSCGTGQECYLRTSTSCQTVDGVRLCPRVAACRYTDPCSRIDCKSYQRCLVKSSYLICEDSCQGYTGCLKYEECYLTRSRNCYGGYCPYVARCRLKATKPGSCPVFRRSGQCLSWSSQCFRDDRCSGANKCCWDGCRLRCVAPYDPSNPCAYVQCQVHQACSVSNGTAYCLDTCVGNGPCPRSQVCHLVDQDCDGTAPCPRKAVCKKPRCSRYTYTYTTNRINGLLQFPGRVTSTNCGQFEGSLIIIATNGLCIRVTADQRYPDTKRGEVVEVYDGYSNNRLVFQGSSLRGVQSVSSGPIITIVFKTPDFGLTNGLYVRYSLQEGCVIERPPTTSAPTTSLPTTSPPTTSPSPTTTPIPLLTTTPPVVTTPMATIVTYTLRTNRRLGVVHFPGLEYTRNTFSGQFRGLLKIMPTNALCINVTADLQSRDTMTGETVVVYDGDTSSSQVWKGSSLRSVYVVSSGPIITVVFRSPDISASNGLHVQYGLNECRNHQPQVITPTNSSHTLTPVITTQPSSTKKPTTNRLSVIDLIVTDESSAMDSMDTTDRSPCLDPCPTPRLGCELVKEDEDDCCGLERCYYAPQSRTRKST